MNRKMFGLVFDQVTMARGTRQDGAAPKVVAGWLNRAATIRRSGNLFAAQIAAGNWSTYWVCTDCMLVHANGECGEDPDCEPLGLIPDTADVSLGLMSEEHAEGCTEDDRSECRCDCEERSFSYSSCDGCGSSLGGERHALTVVYGMREAVTNEAE